MSLGKKPAFNLKVVLLVQFLSLNPEELNTGIQFLGDNIAAALQLVTNEMEWLKTLLQSHQRPPEELDKHINRQGAPIKAWLAGQT